VTDPSPTRRSGVSRSRRRPVNVAAWSVVTALVMAVAGCSGDDPATEAVGGEPTTTVAEPSTTTAPTTTTAPPTTTTTVPPPPVHRPGDGGLEILALEQRLAELGYRPGEADGSYTAATASAVMAYQKHEGLSRDGLAGPQTMGAIFETPQGRGPSIVGTGPLLEIDLDRQIMFVTLADGSISILNISSGNNETYRHPYGYTAVAATPVGNFAVGRKIDAPEVAPLGTLYRPMYFKGGFAVHGSTSVPGYPASHGCVRTSYTDQDWLFPQVPTGTRVVVTSGGPVLDPGTDVPAA
jgi:peptidoglycan hydrolase-like protein with peptidoglycan-binding domain